MQVYEISGYGTGVSREGVNFLQPADSFQNVVNGYVYRQELKSRRGFSIFASAAVSDGSRIMGIFEHVKNNNFTELLVCSKDRLYTYNTGTDAWDLIPMAGSAPATFGISANEHYVSGTTYPDKDGNDRFVFTSQGMTDTYYYDGTDVKSFTLDNPDFEQPAASIGDLTNAWFVFWFGERLNFFNATLGGQQNQRGVLYSGIRNADGNGDKFNVVGAGLLDADTPNFMNGASILGPYIVGSFSNSTWILEKTRDAFNPYLWRKVPGALGTDAPFSSAQWDDILITVGKTGIIGTDSRKSIKLDTKIPYLTADEIDAQEFDLTYGGFDRVNSQFLFSYSDASSGIDTQDRVLVYNYEESSWSVFGVRFSVFGRTQKGVSVVWDDITEANNPAWATWDETEELWDKIGQTAAVEKTLAGDDNGFVYELNTDNDDYFEDISDVSVASSAVVSVTNSLFNVGDQVAITGVTGMEDADGNTPINNYDPADRNAVIDPFTVTAVSGTDVTINVDSSTWTAADPNTGRISKLIDFEAETIPFNPYRSEGRKVYISHVEFLIDTSSGYIVVDIYEDEEDTPFKKDVLVIPRNTAKAREWISVAVNNEANFIRFTMRHNSISSQLTMPAMRIHAKPGGFSDG